MGDHAAANEEIWPSQNDVSQTAGNGKKLLENQWQELLGALTNSNFLHAGGLLPASSGNLNMDVPACQALISGRFVDIPAATTLTAAASSTNHVFLKLTRDGGNLVTGASFEVNTTGTAPADSVKIGTLVASGSAITSTTDARQIGPPALYRGPIAVGAGSTRSHEGDVTISTNQNLSGVHFYSGFSLNSGVTITVPSSGRRLIIVATGTITITGTINSVGAGGAGGAAGIALTSPGGDGGHGIDQPGAAGAASWAAGGAAGLALHHGINVGATTGSAVPLLLDPFSCYGGAGGGGGGGGTLTTYNGGAGGTGGGSVILMAPAVILDASSSIVTSGDAGASGIGDGGAGGSAGAGNIYIITRSYTDNGCTFTQTPNGVKQILLY